MSTKMVLIGLLGLNVALLGGSAYLYSDSSQAKHTENNSNIALVKTQVNEFGKDVEEFGMLYGMLQSQHQQNSTEIEHVMVLQDIIKQVKLLTPKTSDALKKQRLISEMQEWMNKRYSGSVYVEGQVQQLSVLLKLLENDTNEETLNDIQKTGMDIIQTSFGQSMKQSQRFFDQTEKLKVRISGLEKKIQEFK